MKNKAIFLDRDGTIIENKGHIYRLSDLEFIPQAIDGLMKMQEAGYKLIVVTNQAGIAKDLFHESDYFIFREEMHKRLKENGIAITAEYFCPHHKEGIGRYRVKCNCRKPKIGMLEKAAEDFDLKLNECWMIGDKESDITAGKTAGCRTIHVLTGECKKADADFTASNLNESAGYILRDNNK